MDVRPEVAWFAEQMEKQLRSHDAKKGERGWQRLADGYLDNELAGEVAEFRAAIRLGDAGEIIHEAADVANLAMMIADNARRREGGKE